MRLDLDELDDEALGKIREHCTFEPAGVSVLASYSEGDVVSVDGRDSTGVIVSKMTESFNFPVGKTDDGDAKTEEVEASSDEPAYVVAFVSGSMMAVDGGQLSEDSFDTEKGASKEDVKELANKSEEAAVYDYMDDPHGSMAELRMAKKSVMMDQYYEEQCAGPEDYDLEERLGTIVVPEVEYEELVNIRGVDDPHVGFDSLPEGWTRKSVLQAWASLGGTWTSCRADMTGEIRSPKRFCAALKDEVLRTELWRNRF